MAEINNQLVLGIEKYHEFIKKISKFQQKDWKISGGHMTYFAPCHWFKKSSHEEFFNPATLGFVLLDSLECDHIKLESGYVKSVEVENKDNHGAGYEPDKFAQN